jgi:serine protease Do
MSRWRGLAVATIAVASVVTASAVRAGAEEEGQKRDRRVIRLQQPGGYLGVSLGDVGAEDVKRLGLADERGAVVKDVTGESPAERAGIKTDDVVLSYEGETVRSAAHLSRLVRETPPGRKVAMGVSRGGSRQQLEVTVGEPRRLAEALDRLRDLKIEGLDDLDFEGLDGLEMPFPPEPPHPPRPPSSFSWRFMGERPRLGLELVELTDQLARHFKVDDGLLVSRVREGSPAEKGGVKAGDIIVKVDGSPVTDVRDLQRSVGRASADQEVTLTLQRDGRALDVRVRIEARERRRLPAPTT